MPPGALPKPALALVPPLNPALAPEPAPALLALETGPGALAPAAAPALATTALLPPLSLAPARSRGPEFENSEPELACPQPVSADPANTARANTEDASRARQICTQAKEDRECTTRK